MVDSHTAKEAALKLVMGEVGDLLTQCEDLISTLTIVRTEINKDLGEIGHSVNLFKTAQEKLSNQLFDFKIESNATTQPTQAPKTLLQPPKAVKKSIWLPCIISGLIGALIACGAFYYLYKNRIDDAKVGAKLQASWQTLDKQTQDKVNKVLSH